MANVEIRDLTEKTTLDGTELVEIQEAAGGAGSSKNVATANIMTGLSSITDKNFVTDAEKTLIGTVETGADVTDTANVTAAGALMDSELTSIADVKALDQSVISGASPVFSNANFTEATNKNYVTDAEKTVIGNTSGTNTGDKDVVDDTTPQLGGTLDGNNKEINNFKGTINAQTGATYPTVASDTGKVITLNNASPVTITVHSTAAAGFNCTIIQKGAGQVTVAAGGSGTILNKSSHTKLSGQYAIGALFVESNAGTAPQVYFGGDTAA